MFQPLKTATRSCSGTTNRNCPPYPQQVAARAPVRHQPPLVAVAHAGRSPIPPGRRVGTRCPSPALPASKWATQRRARPAPIPAWRTTGRRRPPAQWRARVSRCELNDVAVQQGGRIPELPQLLEAFWIEARAGQADFPDRLHTGALFADSGLRRPTVSLEVLRFREHNPGGKSLDAHLVAKSPWIGVIHGVLALAQRNAFQVPGGAGEKGKTGLRPGGGERDPRNRARLDEGAIGGLGLHRVVLDRGPRPEVRPAAFRVAAPVEGGLAEVRTGLSAAFSEESCFDLCG